MLNLTSDLDLDSIIYGYNLVVRTETTQWVRMRTSAAIAT